MSKDDRRHSPSAEEPEWEREADVVIAGYGGAGAAAAITAHDTGAKVIVLESMVSGGGNTVVSMGGFLYPTNAKDAMTYISALYDFSHSDKDEETIRVFAQESVKNVAWVKGLREGTEVQVYGHAGFPQVPGTGSMNKYLVRGKGKGSTLFARNLWGLLSYAVEEQRKIPVLTKTPAKRLVTNNHGEVIGVIAENEGRKIAIRANRAVILTTGGYEYDKKALQNNIKGYPIYAAGNPGNRGDGIRMAQKVGAALWHMNGVSCGLGIKVPDFKAAFSTIIGAPGHILVDKKGRRFLDERGIESHAGLFAVDHYDAHALEFPRIPCYAIFDETARLTGPISRVAGLGAAGQEHKWSKDNRIEIEKGWIIKGSSPAELAEKLRMDPATLEETVGRWNADVKEGRDSQFNRPIRSAPEERPAYKDFVSSVLSAPIDTPPYYGLELYPCLLNTQGGPRRNARAQVLDPYDQPIPRLYSAGELGSMWGMIYQGAGNIAECMVFGRIAGMNAANETPWA
ncbi:MAG: FAD-binding protein [Proteobacteria bacterium]|nr:FAD-binding protein [Pseudomonadota bacterium]